MDTKQVYMQINTLNRQLEQNQQGQEKPLDLKKELQEQGVDTALEAGLENLLDITIEGGIANIAIPVPALQMLLSIFNKKLDLELEGGIQR